MKPAQVWEYAIGLHDHAVSTLEPSALHAWMVWRLILDCKVEHSEATRVADVFSHVDASGSSRQLVVRSVVDEAVASHTVGWGRSGA